MHGYFVRADSARCWRHSRGISMIVLGNDSVCRIIWRRAVELERLSDAMTQRCMNTTGDLIGRGGPQCTRLME
jgi:hypothetical protein